MVLLGFGRNNYLETGNVLQRQKSGVILYSCFASGHSIGEKAAGPAYFMLSIAVIILFSVVLFGYWFRYSCLLILQNRTSTNQAYTLSSGLTFQVVQQRLRGEGQSVDLLDQLRHDLSNDYRILCFLLRCSADSGVDPIERRMLMMDYWMMQAWYSVTRRAALPQASKAIEEMSNIVSYFAYSVGRNAQPTRS